VLLSALLVVVPASFIHATWHLLAKRTAVARTIIVLVYLSVGPRWPAGDTPADRRDGVSRDPSQKLWSL